jgi:hypothetical protein
MYSMRIRILYFYDGELAYIILLLRDNDRLLLLFSCRRPSGNRQYNMHGLIKLL